MRRTDYENPQPYKTRSVRKECLEETKIHGVLFRCGGVHGPRAKHWCGLKDDFGRGNPVWSIRCLHCNREHARKGMARLRRRQRERVL